MMLDHADLLKHSILCIEDDSTARNMYVSFLQKSGYTVFEAENGVTGLSLFRQKQPDIILLDLKMPDIDGLDILKTVSEESSETPTIVVSGKGEFNDVIESLRFGAFEYLTKPLDSLKILSHAIERAFERLRLIRENAAIKQNLEKANRELEHNVQKRTAELQRVNKLLKKELLERLETEVALRESEAKFKLIFENANDEIVYLDKTGVIIDINNKAEEFTGYKRQELIGKNITELDFLKQGDMLEINTLFQEICSSKSTKLVEYEISTKDKKNNRFIEVSTRIISKNGDIHGFVSIIRDTTERRQMETALRESEDKFKMIFENANDIIAYVSPDGKIIDINTKIEDIFGYTREEVIGKNFSDFPIFDTKTMRNAINRFKITLMDKPCAMMAFKVLKKDGSRAFIEVNSRLITKGSKKLGVINIIRDITERRIAEDALKQSEKKYRLMADNVNDVIWIMGLDLKFLYLSPSIEKLVGYSLEEYMQKSLDQIVTQQSFQQISRLIEEELAKENTDDLDPYRSQKMEAELYHKDGHTIWVEVKASFLREGAAPPTKILGTTRDITERKAIQQRLAMSEERYRSIFEQAADSIIILDPDTGEILEFNDSACANLGYTHDEFKKFQQNVFEIWDSPEKQSLHLEKIKKNEKDICNIKHITKNGEIRNIQANCRTLTVGGKKLLQKVCRDITEEVNAKKALKNERAQLATRVEERTEELRRANEELARVMHHKDEFLANMSHELRTPLTTILGITEVLIEEIYGDLNEKQVSSILNIDESGRHLLSMINDILDISKIEAGKMDLNIESIAVTDVCQSITRMTNPMVKKKDLKLSIHIDNNIEFIRADIRRLKQMLLNLLNNAVKFTPPGKEIGLDITENIDTNGVNITVWDQGPGISDDEARQLFKPFVQLDSSLAKKHGGTGLGLYLVYRLVKMHNGSIKVESEIGGGSRFTIALPRQTYTAASVIEPLALPKDTALPEPDSKPLAKILVVDDNKTNVEVLNDYLHAHKYSTFVAYNGEDAINSFFENHPDIVLMDIQLPGMSGLTAIETIRKQEIDNKKIPILALTALAMPGDMEQCIKAGANGYLSKPVSLKNLVNAINEQLQSSATL